MELAGPLAAVILLALWFSSHVLVLNIVCTEKYYLTMVLCLLFLSAAYLLKPSTSDLPKYSVYFSTGYLAVHDYHVDNTGDVSLGKLVI